MTFSSSCCVSCETLGQTSGKQPLPPLRRLVKMGALPAEPQRWPFCTWTACCRLAGGRRMKRNSKASASPRRPAKPNNEQGKDERGRAHVHRRLTSVWDMITFLLTTENFPSPNHITQRVPSAARLRPLIHQETMRPGHQEKPRSFPKTRVPMPKPRPSCQRAKNRQAAHQRSPGEAPIWKRIWNDERTV